VTTGERTAKFRLGKDDLLVNGRGSRISFEDYAIAKGSSLLDRPHNPLRIAFYEHHIE
jgi:putative NADH-flavin reductase